MSRLIRQRPPTHTLLIEVPVDLSEREEMDFDPLQDALRICLALSRVGTADVLCDTPNVTLREAAA